MASQNTLCLSEKRPGLLPAVLAAVSLAQTGHPKSLSLRCSQRLQAGVQPTLVTGDGVQVQNALLDALVESRNSLAVLRLGRLNIALGDSFAQSAKAGAHAGAVRAVDRRAGLGLAGALQR